MTYSIFFKSSRLDPAQKSVFLWQDRAKSTLF
jgi:hypothetical protein